MTDNNSRTAKVHYTGKLSDGSVFDTSREREPFEFVVGVGQVIQGFDNAVSEMVVGDVKTVTIPADQAYGPHVQNRVYVVGHDQFAEGVKLQVGMQLQSESTDGQPPMVATVTEINEENVVLDANHPLAGQELTFEIELLELV